MMILLPKSGYRVEEPLRSKGLGGTKRDLESNSHFEIREQSHEKLNHSLKVTELLTWALSSVHFRDFHVAVFNVNIYFSRKQLCHLLVK